MIYLDIIQCNFNRCQNYLKNTSDEYRNPGESYKENKTCKLGTVYS